MLDKELVREQKRLYDEDNLNGFVDCLKRAKDVSRDHEELQSCINKLLACTSGET
ncbi:MAG: hypothetical protein ACLFVL_06780 [Candidatus Aenigmatarchaeota archaeon]